MRPSNSRLKALAVVDLCRTLDQDDLMNSRELDLLLEGTDADAVVTQIVELAEDNPDIMDVLNRSPLAGCIPGWTRCAAKNRGLFK